MCFISTSTDAPHQSWGREQLWQQRHTWLQQLKVWQSLWWKNLGSVQEKFLFLPIKKKRMILDWTCIKTLFMCVFFPCDSHNKFPKIIRTSQICSYKWFYSTLSHWWWYSHPQTSLIPLRPLMVFILPSSIYSLSYHLLFFHIKLKCWDKCRYSILHTN